MSIKLVSIYKKSNRKFYSASYLYNGKQYYISLKCSKKIEAYECWLKIKDNIINVNNNLLKENNSVPLIKTIINDFLAFRKNNTQASTFQSDRIRILNILDYCNSGKIETIYQINESIVRIFINELESRKVSNKAVNNYITIIKGIVEYINKKYNANILIDFKKFWRKKTKKTIELFNKKQAQQLIQIIKTIKQEDYKVFLLTAFYTGLRLSEIRALNRESIDLEKRIIHIREKKTCYDKKPSKTLKSRAANRTIPILKEFLPFFKEYLQNNQQDYIFQQITYKKLLRIRLLIQKEVGFPFRFHDIRHFFASILINNRFDLKTIQYIIGHADIATTLNVYGHLINDINPDDFDHIRL